MAAIHPMIQVQDLNQGKYRNLTGLPILKLPKYPSEGNQKQFKEKSSQVKPGMTVLDSTSFSYASEVRALHSSSM
jgi:hypothetical protein